MLHRSVPGAPADEPRHADVVRIVVLDELLAPKGVDDRRLQRRGELDQLLVCPGNTCSRQDRDGLGFVQYLGSGGERLVVGTDDGGRRADGTNLEVCGHFCQEHLARDDDDRDAALADGSPHGDLEHVRHLLRDADELAVDGELPVEVLGMGLLEISAAYLFPWNVRRDREHWHVAAARVPEAIDEMEIARAATGGGHRQLAADRGLTGCGERGRFLMADVLPRDFAVSAQRVGEAVQGVARNAVHTTHA